jgi:cytoskeletal protein CcmA (bactofilin family)
MFAWRRRGTIIGEGLKVVGKVTAEGLVKVYGQIDGELQCASLILSPNAHVKGAITAEKVVIGGRVEGPIEAAEVVLKSRAHVVGDIHHQSLAIKRGAYFEGRSVQLHGANGRQPDKVGKKQSRHAANNSREAIAVAEQPR